MALTITLVLTRYAEQLEKRGVAVMDDKLLRDYIYRLLEKDLERVK